MGYDIPQERRKLKMAPDNRLKHMEILIAEDEKNIGDLLVELLADEQRNITVVHNGAEAVQLLEQRPFDLLITDLMMPEVDGMEVLHHAKTLYPDIQAIIITGYASLETAIQAVKEGAYDYLRKPFRLEELKISVDNACERIALIRENNLLLENLRRVQGESQQSESSREEVGLENPASAYMGSDVLSPILLAPGPVSGSNTLDELERLGNLRQQGVITEEEFIRLKEKLLNRL